MRQSKYQSVSQSINHSSFYLSITYSIYFMSLSVYLIIHPSIYLSVQVYPVLAGRPLRPSVAPVLQQRHVAAHAVVQTLHVH